MGSIEIFDSAEQISKWTTEIYQVKVYSDSNWSNRSNNKTTLTYKYTRSYQYLKKKIAVQIAMIVLQFAFVV